MEDLFQNVFILNFVDFSDPNMMGLLILTLFFAWSVLQSLEYKNMDFRMTSVCLSKAWTDFNEL